MQVRKITGTEVLTECGYFKRLDHDRVRTDNSFVAITSGEHTIYYQADRISVDVQDPSTVFVVIKDAINDMGRSHFHSVYRSFDDAVAFVASQGDFVSGKPAKVCNYPDINIHGEPYVVSGFRLYDIRPTTLLGMNMTNDQVNVARITELEHEVAFGAEEEAGDEQPTKGEGE